MSEDIRDRSAHITKIIELFKAVAETTRLKRDISPLIIQLLIYGKRKAKQTYLLEAVVSKQHDINVKADSGPLISHHIICEMRRRLLERSHDR